MDAVEREPVETRVLNPTSSEASYKPKQRSYRITNLKKKLRTPDSPGAEMSSAESAALKRTRPHNLAPIMSIMSPPIMSSYRFGVRLYRCTDSRTLGFFAL